MAAAPAPPEDISAVGIILGFLKDWGGALLGGSALTGIFLGGQKYQDILSTSQHHERKIGEHEDKIERLREVQSDSALRLAEIPTRTEMHSSLARMETLMESRFNQIIALMQK